MMLKHNYDENPLSDNSFCIIIPTYNNEGTLLSVIESVKPYSRCIIVVNDGSTDDTSTILASTEGIHILEYKKNRGKGHALKTGFQYAGEMGYRNAITLDSDGQHYAEDMLKLIQKYDQVGSAIIIGSRENNHINKPMKNTFANKFSNFWFNIQTGQYLEDTQSGFRLYPIDRIANIHLFSTRYEFELEVLVRSAWRGIPIQSIPICVFYDEKDKRITHFRPVIDFLRISILNFLLTMLAILYFRPKLILSKLFQK